MSAAGTRHCFQLAPAEGPRKRKSPTATRQERHLKYSPEFHEPLLGKSLREMPLKNVLPRKPPPAGRRVRNARGAVLGGVAGVVSCILMG